jgi:hypothetical protein
MRSDTRAEDQSRVQQRDRIAEITAALADLQRRQDNLMRELERCEPSGDADFDISWRQGLQRRFRSMVAEQRTLKQALSELRKSQDSAAEPDLSLIDTLPVTDQDVTLLPESYQRRLYDAFHLQIRYDDRGNALVIRVTIDSETAPGLAAAANDTLHHRPHPNETSGHGSATERAESSPASGGGMFCVPPAGDAEHPPHGTFRGTV